MVPATDDNCAARSSPPIRAMAVAIVNILYLLAVAVALYWVSDQILNLIETRRGRRLDHRSILFFMIILSLALVTFWLIRQLAPA